MAPVAKSYREKGQISIFFSASLVVLISIIAFVINIGLFVKAKINLQNATDAAAYAGASVQARHLSRIAYLNWEMRNIYKEWMYKYYVIGNLNVDDVENADPTGGTTGPMNFRLRTDTNVITGSSNVDYYNIPAVCIHIAGSKTNICRRYSIPGLPEFGSSQLPGAEEASRAFMDALIGTKINDCIERTKLNMLVATTWAFNVQSNENDDTLVGRGPAILANRQGAWPKAVELAMRMRNLEFAMNRPPETQGICMQSGGGVTSCRKNINDVIAEKRFGNERIVKAFFSGYRNLGNEYDSEMKDSFTLTELPPKPYTPSGQASASYLLVPNSNKFPKYYLDLRLQMINFAIFYAAMIPRATGDTSGACDISKAAIPVPGYPLGFYKNPDVVTYYAVRGEAKFIGMFNPFQQEGIKLTAYSAAKPMGGRIGPMLFTQRTNQDFFTSRQSGGGARKSVPYITTLDFLNTPRKDGAPLKLGDYSPGVPLPVNDQDSFFWLQDASKPLGGLIPGGDIQFGIPNLVYEYDVPYTNQGYLEGSDTIHVIRTSNKPSPPKGSAEDKSIGLFSKSQLGRFKGNFPSALITQQDLEYQIDRVRAATIYETANYLVPTPNDLNLDSSFPLESFGAIGTKATSNRDLKQYQTSFFAPLVKSGTDQTDILWNSANDVVGTVFDFLRQQEQGIDKYRKALNKAAKTVYDMGNNVASEAVNSKQKYQASASGISDINFGTNNFDQFPASCKSIAGQFLHYYYGDQDLKAGIVPNTAGCPLTLGKQLRDYFGSGIQNAAQGQGFSPTHYQMTYNYFPSNFARAVHNPKPMTLFSAYMPGPYTGVGLDGNFKNPINADGQENTRRNFYSTKFISLESTQGGALGYSQQQNQFPIMSEGLVTPGSADISQETFRNSLDASSVGADLSSIKY